MTQRPPEPRASRTAAGHTQKQAAEVMGISYRTWQDWERGIAPVPATSLRLYRHITGLERIPFRSAPQDRMGQP